MLITDYENFDVVPMDTEVPVGQILFQKPKDILDADLYFIDEIGLKEHLSPTRANGLVSMIKQIKLYALAFHSKLS